MACGDAGPGAASPAWKARLKVNQTPGGREASPRRFEGGRAASWASAVEPGGTGGEETGLLCQRMIRDGVYARGPAR